MSYHRPVLSCQRLKLRVKHYTLTHYGYSSQPRLKPMSQHQCKPKTYRDIFPYTGHIVSSFGLNTIHWHYGYSSQPRLKPMSLHQCFCHISTFVLSIHHIMAKIWLSICGLVIFFKMKFENITSPQTLWTCKMSKTLEISTFSQFWEATSNVPLISAECLSFVKVIFLSIFSAKIVKIFFFLYVFLCISI